MVVRLTEDIQDHAVHIAIYRWKEDAPIPDLEETMDKLRGMAEDVPGIRLITWGRNTNKWAEGFTHAILIIGETEEDIEKYRKHPLHKEVADFIDTWEGFGVGVDFKRPIDFDTK